MSTNPTDSLINCELIAEAGETDTVVMILTVRTADGLELKHSYPISSGYEACTAQWNEALGAIHAALEAKGPLLQQSTGGLQRRAYRVRRVLLRWRRKDHRTDKQCAPGHGFPLPGNASCGAGFMSTTGYATQHHFWCSAIKSITVTRVDARLSAGR